MILVKSAIFQLNAISHRCVFSLERTVQTDANQRFGTFKQVAQGYAHISFAYLHSHMMVAHSHIYEAKLRTESWYSSKGILTKG